jgi:cyclophilin family peptidyl-prolyl cis-trans isomerase
MNDGTGEIGYTIDAEISDLKHERGSVAMARKGNDLNSASSQFYIALNRLPNLDGSYTVFGKVVKGMDIVDIIADVKTDARNNPIERVEMFKVWVGKEKSKK